VDTIQTFLPYPDFEESAAVLDMKRLGKQRVENLQIIQVLTGTKVANTTKQVETGRFRTIYFDDENNEIEDPWFLISGDPDVFRPEEIPIMKNVTTDKSEWRIHLIETPGWRNHPVVHMWRGYEWALMEYQTAICAEWTNRGYKDTCFDKSMFLMLPHLKPNSDVANTNLKPPWLGDPDLHKCYQSILIAKDPEHYWPHFPDVEPWPEHGVFPYPKGVM
jgi:hypothetical protein